MFPDLKKYLSELDINNIPKNRLPVLDELRKYIQESIDSRGTVKLNFICTHNSRRSQLGQVWAAILGSHFNLPVYAYSGGTEATAFNERAVKALGEAGLKIKASGVRHQASGKDNLVYELCFDEDQLPVVAFSKVYDHPDNPDTQFAAVMTCADADENCPFIPGAEKRIPLRYDDPKVFDGTPEEAEKYAERSRQIASELYFVFSKINQP